MPAVLGAYWVVKLVLIAASIAYSRRQQQKIKKAIKRLYDLPSEASQRTETALDPQAYSVIVYGECRVGGTIIFRHVNGSNNQYRHLVVVMADHPVEAFTQLFFDDELVTLDGAGNAIGRYAGYVQAHFFLGNQTSISPLNTYCPEVWDSNHAISGRSGVYVRLAYNPDLFPNGIPNISAVCRGKKVYDPRSDLTTWTRNAALIMADYMTDAKLGMGLDYYSRINEDELIASANICDESIAIPGSNEKRYSINCAISTDTVHEDVLDEMKEAFAGAFTYVSGRWSIMAGYWREPTHDSFTEDSFVGPITVQTARPSTELFNRVKGSYISPEAFWNAADFPPVINSTFLTQDGNEEAWSERQFHYVTSPYQCQRLAKIALEKIRQQITIELVGDLRWLTVQCGDVVPITIPDYGFDGKLFECTSITERTNDDGAIVYDVSLSETASAVWDWSNGEETEVDPAPNTTLPNPFSIAAPTGLTVVADNTTREEVLSGSFVPRIKVNWTAPADEYVRLAGQIRLQYKKVSSSTWHDVVPVPGSQTEVYIQNPVEATAYHVRIRSENRLGIHSAWVYSDPTTSTGDTTPPAAPTGFTASGATGGIALHWTNPADSDFSHIEIYEHTANTPNPSGGSAPYATTTGPTINAFFRGSLSAGITRFYWVRAVDTSGNKSSWVGPQGATTASPLSATCEPPFLVDDYIGTGGTETYTCIVTGGVGPFSYEWQVVTSSTPAPIIFSPNGSSTIIGFWFNLSSEAPYATATLRCKVTDSAGTIVYTQESDAAITFLPEDRE